MAFSIYKWRRDQLLLENNTSNDAGGTELIKSKQYSKEDIIKAVGMYGKIKLGSGEAIPVSNLDNEGKYTYTMDSYSVSAQKAVPVFIPAGKPKSIGGSDKSIKYQIDLEKEKGKKPRLDENENKPTHRSNVDWYYVEEYSDYPGPKGRTVPNARGYEDPTGYDGTELYVPEGTVGYVDGNKFIVTSGKREGNDVEYKAEYFDEISGNQVNEFLKIQKLAGIITEDQYRKKLSEMEGDPDDYYGYNEPIDPNDYADDNGGSGNQLADIIEDNKAALAKQFNLIDPMVSWNAEGEPVMMTDDNDEQVDFIKVEDWENNKGFYNRNDGVGEITLDGVDIIYVVNPFG